MKLTTHHRLGARLGIVLTIFPHPYVSSWRAEGQFLLFFLAEINIIWTLLPQAVQKIRLISIILFYTRVTEDSTVTWFLSYLLTYLLSPCSKVLLEKPTGSQLVKKFPTFYRIRRFITTFTRARHLSLS